LNRKGQQRIDPASIKKILLVRLRRIGDIILTTPAITVLRKVFPQAFISYVVEDPYKDLVIGSSNIDKVIVFPQNSKVKDFFRHIRRIRKEKYDVLIDFHGGPRAALITFFSKAKLKIGYQIKHKNFIYDVKIPRKPGGGYIHSVENHINLVKTLGIKIESPPPLHLPPVKKAVTEKMNKIFSTNDLRGHKIIPLHIGAGNEFRKWGIGNFVELINLLSQIPDVKIAMIGSQEDKNAEEEIQRKFDRPLFSLVGQLNLMELRQFITNSSLFIGPDSGPMHMAAATPTPIVALFGPNLSSINSPWKAKAVVIEKELDCRPCDQRHCIHGDIRCLRSITPKEVYEACLKYI